MNTFALEILFRGVAVGALAVIGVAFWRGATSQPLRVAGVLLALGASGYALNSSTGLVGALGVMTWPVHFFALGGGGLFWLFVVTLFEDRPITPLTLAPWAVLTAIGFIALALPPPERGPVFVVHNIVQAGLALHALFVIARSWRDDLIEARRRLRGPLLAGVSGFTLGISAAEMAMAMGYPKPWYGLVSGAVLAAFSVAGAAIFLRADTQLFGAAQPAKPKTPSLQPIAPFSGNWRRRWAQAKPGGAKA